jgi:hypothetical protein
MPLKKPARRGKQPTLPLGGGDSPPATEPVPTLVPELERIRAYVAANGRGMTRFTTKQQGGSPAATHLESVQTKSPRHSASALTRSSKLPRQVDAVVPRGLRPLLMTVVCDSLLRLYRRGN